MGDLNEAELLGDTTAELEPDHDEIDENEVLGEELHPVKKEDSELYDAAIESSHNESKIESAGTPTPSTPTSTAQNGSASATVSSSGTSGRRWCCYVGNMTWWTTDNDLANACTALGVNDLVDIKFYDNRTNGQSKGYCLCVFASEPSVQKLTSDLPKRTVHGQSLVVLPYSKMSLQKFEEAAAKNLKTDSKKKEEGVVHMGTIRIGAGGSSSGPGGPSGTSGGQRGGPSTGQMGLMGLGRSGPAPMGGNIGPIKIGGPMGQMRMGSTGIGGPMTMMGRGAGPMGPSGPMMGVVPNMNMGGPGMRPGGAMIGGGPMGINPPQISINLSGPPPVNMMSGPPPQGMPNISGPPPQQMNMMNRGLMTGQMQPPPGMTQMMSGPQMGMRPGIPPAAQGPPGIPPGAHINPQVYPGFNQMGGAPPGVAPGVAPGTQPQGAPGMHMRPPGAGGPISEGEFEEVMNRNRTVSSSAISRAVSDAAAGDVESAVETLLTAISLIKQSKVAHDDRCKLLITSLQDTLAGIESKASASSSRKHRRDRSRSRSRERDRKRHRRSRSRSRSRDYDRRRY